MPQRREVLRAGGLLGALAVASPLRALILEDAELPYLGATQVLRGMQTGEFSAEVYVEALLRARRACRHLNLIRSDDPPQLLAAARQADERRGQGQLQGPLHGLPVVLCDSINSAGLPTSGGTPALQHNQPSLDAPVAARLLVAGALVGAKTNLHELALGVTSNNSAFGAVANPYNPGMIPGGG